MADIDIHFHLNFSSRAVRLAMIGAMVLAAAPELASESVTLTTYYPAPSGVYTNMIATSNSWMARDGGYLDVATYVAPAAGTVLSVAGQTVIGYNSTMPTLSKSYAAQSAGNLAALLVWGNGGTNPDLTVTGRIQTGDGSNSGGVWLSNAGNMLVGQNGANVGFWTSGAGWNALQITPAGFVGIGNQAPAYTLDVTGTINATAVLNPVYAP